jgi:hypothetical protein
MLTPLLAPPLAPVLAPVLALLLRRAETHTLLGRSPGLPSASARYAPLFE